MVQVLNFLEEHGEIVSLIYSVVLLPIITYIGTTLSVIAKNNKIDKYTNILKDGIENAVKDVQQTYVEELKKNGEWTEETMIEALQLAKNKAIYTLSNSAYKALRQANQDFDAYIETLIEAKLYDLKNN